MKTCLFEIVFIKENVYWRLMKLLSKQSSDSFHFHIIGFAK